MVQLAVAHACVPTCKAVLASLVEFCGGVGRATWLTGVQAGWQADWLTGGGGGQAGKWASRWERLGGLAGGG